MTEPFKKETGGFYQIAHWETTEPGLVAGVTHKTAGAGVFDALNMAFHVQDDAQAVQQNRRQAAGWIGVPAGVWVGCEQTHGSRVERVTARHKGSGALDYHTALRDTDGLYTDERGMLLTLCFADCVPLFFLDRRTKRIGAAHAGWKGTVAGIGKRMIERWVEEGSQAQDIEAVIGPSICQSCYEVSEPVVEAAARWYEDGEVRPYVKTNDAYHLSLQMLNRDILVKAGLSPGHIFTTAHCSSCSGDFFSHRRDDGKTGRMMSYIGWKEEDQCM